MKQVFRIFLKDTRSFWPEILLSLATLTALALIYAAQWKLPANLLGDPPKGGDFTQTMELMQARNHFTQVRQEANTFCSLLVLAGWLVVIARVIHAEPLVGDRQFWTTRPYGRTQLLAAKVLFVLVFLYLPLAITQATCIALAGLNPLDGLWAIGLYLAVLTGLVALPVLAIAAVTESLLVLTLTTVGSAAAWLLITNFWFHQNIEIAPGIHLEQLARVAVSLGILSAAVIAVQYATRRTVLSRAIFITGSVALVLCAHRPPEPNGYNDYYRAQARKLQNFPANDYTVIAQAPFQLSLRQDRPVTTWVTKDWQHQPVVDVRIPMNLAALDGTAPAHLEMFRAELTGADGFTWSTMQNEFFPAEIRGTSHFYPGVLVPVAVYKHLEEEPATLKMTLYYGKLQQIDVTRAALTGASTDIPGDAHCGPTWGRAWVGCRVVARQTPILNVNADFSAAPCPASHPELQEGAGSWWSGFGESEYKQGNLIPIREFSFTFDRYRNNATGGTHLCSGAPIAYTRYRYADRKQATFTIANFQLPANPSGLKGEQ